MKKINYPLFRDPEEYLNFRKGDVFTAPVKRWAEWHVLNRCLKGFKDIRKVCDCPCGPGRLFPYWKKKGFNLIGVDLSDEMIEAACKQRCELNIPGSILKADAFHLSEAVTEKPDLVVSIRFCHYFDRAARVKLLRSLAQASRKYVLVQYKTPVTIKGRFSFVKSLRSTHPKYFSSNRDIIDEIKEAGLIPLRIILKGDTSDRAFILAQKLDVEVAIRQKSKIYYPRTLRNSVLAAAVLLFFGFVSYHQGFFGDVHERIIEKVVRKYQDGNDHFYVADSPYLEDLRTGKWLSLMQNIDDADELAAIDRTEAEDSFFLVLKKDIPNIMKTPLWTQLCIVEEVEIGTGLYVLLSTEKIISPNKQRPGTSYLILSLKTISA